MLLKKKWSLFNSSAEWKFYESYFNVTLHHSFIPYSDTVDAELLDLTKLVATAIYKWLESIPLTSHSYTYYFMF